jgi:hypothetical protein
MGCTIGMRCKEHAWFLRLYQPDKLVAAEHSFEEGHHINFKDTRVLAGTVGYMGQIMKHAIKIWLHPKNFNRNIGFNLSRSWNPVTSKL